MKWDEPNQWYLFYNINIRVYIQFIIIDTKMSYKYFNDNNKPHVHSLLYYIFCYFD